MRFLTLVICLGVFLSIQNVSLYGEWCSKYSRKQTCDLPKHRDPYQIDPEQQKFNNPNNRRVVYDAEYFDVERDFDELPDVIEVRFPEDNNPFVQVPYVDDTEQENSDYRLKIGDVLRIAIYGEDGTVKDVMIDPRGMLTYLFADPILATGMTIDELRDALQKEISKFYRFVTLSISPVKFNAEYFTVAGEVNQAGRKPFVGRPTLLSAVCQGNGLTKFDFRNRLIDMADLDRAFLARRGEYVPIDFNRLIHEGDLSLDLRLQPGDYIYIPSRQVKKIYALGEVNGPGTIDYYESISLAEVLAEVGDVTELASSRAVIIRGSLHCPVKYLVDYMRILKGCSPDFPLCPGDIVYVPPRRFTTIREIFRVALWDFVDIAAGVAGYRAFLNSHPHAEDDDNIGFFITGPSTSTNSTGTTGTVGTGEVINN